MIKRFFSLNPPSLAGEVQSEHSQTKVRLAILVIICIYIFTMGTTLAPIFSVAPWAKTILIYYAFYTPCALALFYWAKVRPGHYPVRRFASMLLDYGSLGFSITIEPMVMIPLHTVILWITLGNGLRYWKRYLWIATVFALITINIVCLIIPSTANAPFMLIMLLLSVITIPQYASSLLGRVEQARAEADAANLAKSRFLAQASHDLRQPLHAISLFIVSLQQTGLNAVQRNITDRIDRSLQGVARLFRSLLDLSTLDSGAIDPKIEPVALGELLTDIVQQNAQLAAWNDTELKLVATNKAVLTDRTLLTTMIQNLLSNALKFSSGRAVLIGCRKQGETIAIQIWDQGDGIAQEHLPHLFEEFFQVKKAGDPDRQGVGLGLSIVARMAKLLGLTVGVNSLTDRGSCFTIGHLNPLPESSVQTPVNSLSIDQSPLTGFRILLVEDDIDILAATKELLDVWGCITTASNGIPDEAGTYDLIVTDYDLGGSQSGADCIDIIRSRSGWAVPAIIISGHDENRIAGQIDDPAISVLKKPVRPAELRSSIGAARAMLLQKTGSGWPDAPAVRP
jgi:signal transduction histidine kinase/CheY-like chemotaxis protein